MIDSRTKPLASGKWRSGRLGAKVWLGTLMALLLMALPGPSWGAGAVNAVVNINAPLASSAQLTLNPTVINFRNADPDTVPSISADFPVQVTANATTGSRANCEPEGPGARRPGVRQQYHRHQ